MLAFTLMVMPAMASVQNVKISGDIESTYLSRQSLDFGITDPTAGADGIYDQSAIITQTRLRVDADLTDKVSATIAMINERAWGDGGTTAAATDMDLNLAYVTMKEMLYSPLTVTIGRQEFAFGNSFVIDSAGANNVAPADSNIAAAAGDLTKQTAQDAIRLTFDYDPLTLDFLWSKIDQNNINGTILTDDINLYGVNAMYELGDARNTVVEAYFWYKHDDSVQNDATGSDADTVFMPGIHTSMNVTDDLSLSAEFAYQFGTIYFEGNNENARRSAYAGQILSNYRLPFEGTAKYAPVLGIAYSLFSGDEVYDTTGNSASGEDVYHGWDPMYENQAGGKLSNALFNNSNIQVIGTNLTFSPMEDVTADVYYDHIWLMTELETGGFDLINPAGGTIDTSSIEDTSKDDIGGELGMTVVYDYTEDVQLGARVGWFFPGNYYGNNSQEAASQLMLSAKVAF